MIWLLTVSPEIPNIEISMQIGNQISQQVGSAMSAAAWMFNPWRTNWLDVVGVTTILTTIILSYTPHRVSVI